jgi:hypothetical protein
MQGLRHSHGIRKCQFRPPVCPLALIAAARRRYAAPGSAGHLAALAAAILVAALAVALTCAPLPWEHPAPPPAAPARLVPYPQPACRLP